MNWVEAFDSREVEERIADTDNTKRVLFMRTGLAGDRGSVKPP
jgi:hypothetical protein